MAKQTFPEPTVGAFIFDPDDRLLLVRSHKWHGKWVVPGGHIELGETLKEALLREALEETGLEVTRLHFIGHQEFIYNEAFWKPRHFIFFDFSCRSLGTNVTLNSEAQEYTWVTLPDALAMEIDQYTRNSLEILASQTGP